MVTPITGNQLFVQQLVQANNKQQTGGWIGCVGCGVRVGVGWGGVGYVVWVGVGVVGVVGVDGGGGVSRLNNYTATVIVSRVVSV